ncbi:MFS general substrate transporter [Mycena sanguinolenta]|uniref:MFS general substrate transporter n=1 Tax=Mycena sanguinolenta TaxID=230812 RepID=A0A8H6ZFA5_9AGAR|nr:MFS general substrate transporter [Mycena sanguinolenta]
MMSFIPMFALFPLLNLSARVNGVIFAELTLHMGFSCAFIYVRPVFQSYALWPRGFNFAVLPLPPKKPACHRVLLSLEQTTIAMLSELSTELIRTISGHLDQRDQLVLSRTSRRMHAICVEWIYRILSFGRTSPRPAVQLLQRCKTILARQETAISVWELKIYCLPSYTSQSFHSILRSATARMKNLRVINILSLRLFRTVSGVVFSQLTDCTIPLSPDCYSFLPRNPTIEYIFIIPDPHNSLLNNFYGIQPIHMPQLRYFQGPEVAVRAVVPGTPVSVLTIWWGREPAMELSCGLAAAAFFKADPCELTNMIVSWDPELLGAIAQRAPRIQFLNIRMILPSSTSDKEVTLTKGSSPGVATAIPGPIPSALPISSQFASASLVSWPSSDTGACYAPHRRRLVLYSTEAVRGTAPSYASLAGFQSNHHRPRPFGYCWLPFTLAATALSPHELGGASHRVSVPPCRFERAKTWRAWRAFGHYAGGAAPVKDPDGNGNGTSAAYAIYVWSLSAHRHLQSLFVRLRLRSLSARRHPQYMRIIGLVSSAPESMRRGEANPFGRGVLASQPSASISSPEPSTSRARYLLGYRQTLLTQRPTDGPRARLDASICFLVYSRRAPRRPAHSSRNTDESLLRSGAPLRFLFSS